MTVSVKRVVARVVVTSTADSYVLNGDDPYTKDAVETNYKIGTISDLHFVTVQSERALYFQQGEATVNTSVSPTFTAKWHSPAWNQLLDVTKKPLEYTKGASTEANNILAAYDYTNLWKKHTVGALGGNVIATENKTSWTAKEVGELAHNSDFILPTTHEYVAFAEGANYKYRKGNTAYVLIRGLFVPNKIQKGDSYAAKTAGITALDKYVTAVQNATGAVLNADATVKTPAPAVDFSTLKPAEQPEYLVYGIGTKKFYTSEYASQDPVYGGAIKQPIQKFQKVTENGKVGYKMLYFAWVNPDTTAKWYNSPVYRNNIYHIEIDGIGGLGENWNPLVPGVPGTPGGGTPTTPSNSNDPKHPNNPDPYIPNTTTPIEIPNPTPGGGTVPTPTPVTPPENPVTPIKPEDPLTQDKTHMSVKVSVLPWQVHSYKKKLEN